jgi:4-diphosphocytidyl-2C-methyl-D-erythritol kinase
MLEKCFPIAFLSVQPTRKPECPFSQIHLDKKVPTGAGLGGGSGNAATALWAANELTGRPASNAQLMEWGAEIGSDVPVFFSRGAAYCTGRGEVRHSKHWFVLLDTNNQRDVNAHERRKGKICPFCVEDGRFRLDTTPFKGESW